MAGGRMGDKHDEDEEGAMTGFTGWHCGECWGGQDKDIQQICSQSCVDAARRAEFLVGRERLVVAWRRTGQSDWSEFKCRCLVCPWASPLREQGIRLSTKTHLLISLTRKWVCKQVSIRHYDVIPSLEPTRNRSSHENDVVSL